MSDNEKAVSMAVVRRLPRYYRFLSELLSENVVRISSRELAQRMGVTASQIRQDLNCFGGFGQQGYGYNVAVLLEEISRILYVKDSAPTILIGVGNMGRAVLTHLPFELRGFSIIGAFDKSQSIVGSRVGSHTVAHVDTLHDFCLRNKPLVAVLCIPKEAAVTLSAQLIEDGVRAFWNFSHYDIALNHPGVVVQNVHLGDSLMTLSYLLHHPENSGSAERE